MPFYLSWLGELASLSDLDRAKLIFLPELLSDYARNAGDTEQLHSFFTALCAWARRWNFTDAWCFEEALQTLSLWHLRSAKRNDWAYALQIESVECEDAPELDIRNLLGLSFGLDIQTNTAHSFREKILTTFRDRLGELNFENRVAEALDTYYARIKANSKAKTARKHSSQHHFEWLIDYQINGRELSEIARTASSNGADNNTVRDAIKSIARDIGLTLRMPKAKPGRPRRPKHS